MKRWIACILLPFSALVEQNPAPATDITVRLIDVRNGQVVANENVSVAFHLPGVAEEQRLDGKSGTDGTAKFHLPEPMPLTIYVMATTQLYACYSLFPVDPDRLLHEGILSRCSKPSQQCRCKFSTQALETHYKAGELVLPVRPFTKGERFRRHLWE